MVSYKKKENVTHSFDNLPHAVTRIKATYTSDSDFRFGLTYDIWYANGQTVKFKKSFSNITNMRVIVNGLKVVYETGNYVEQRVTKYRYFEQGSLKWLPFLLGDVSKAFDCQFVFDSYNQQINVYSKSNFGEYKGLNLNYDNGIKLLTKKKKIGEIVTNLTVESPNCSIAEENPLGGEMVENYSYYINSGIMSSSLVGKLNRYNKLVEEKQVLFLQLKLEKNTLDQRLTKKDSELKTLQEQLKVENALLTAYIKANDSVNQNIQSQIVTQKEQDIERCLMDIQSLKDQILVKQDAILNIGKEISKDNATDNSGKIFTSDDLDELNDYVVEGVLQNEYYTLPYSLYQHAISEIEKMNSVYIEFTIDTYDFLSKIIHPNGWQYMLGIGDKIEIDDNEITDVDGFIQLYGYTYYPNENRVGALKFTNNKQPYSAMRTIGDVGRKVQSQTTMTNFWKDTWKDSQNNNVAVKDIIDNGLDVASQIVRGRGTSNKIDISESGIYIIDSQDENKQIYIGSGLISLTTDKWKTSKLAIDSSGVIADTIAGRLIIGEKLQIGNADNTITILPDGIRIFDQKSSKEERIFIGLETVNGVKQARLRLHSANDSSKLVLSEQGIWQMVGFNGRDNLDRYNPFEMSFYISNNYQRLDEGHLRLRLRRFRAYSKGASNSSQSVTSATVSTNGGYGNTSSSNGGQNITATTTTSGTGTGDVFNTGGTHISVNKANGYVTSLGNNPHTHSVVIPNRAHSHSVTVSIPSHNHSFNINSHSHTSSVTIPAHGHDILYGIYEYSDMCNLKLYVDNILVAENIGSDRDFDIMPYLKYAGGWHSIRIESMPLGNDIGLMRVEIDGHIGGFCSY